MKNITILIITLLSFSTNIIQSENIKALIIFPNQYGANSFLILEKLDEFGWENTTTGVTPVVQPCYWGVPVEVDTIISEINNIASYNCIILCPARSWQNPPNAYNDILNSPEAMNMYNLANESGLIIFATCAGVRVLAAADIINGINITGNPNYQNEYTAAGANYIGNNIPPVIDENIVTSTRGQYYWNQNPEAIKTAFENQLNKK